MQKALITGVPGQDGAYLAEFLLSKGYEVDGSSAPPRCSTAAASTTCTRTRTRRAAERDGLIKKHGYKATDYHV